MFFVYAMQEELKNATITGQVNHLIIVTQSLMLTVLEKLCFRDRLAWTVNLTQYVAFSNFSGIV